MTQIVPMGMETCKDVITVSAEKTDITLIMNTPHANFLAPIPEHRRDRCPAAEFSL